MGKTRLRLDDFRHDYASALRRHLRQGGEASLQNAYELGRRGMACDLGVLDMVSLHHEALALIFNGGSSPEKKLVAIHKAAEFFAESMSPFEMTHRTFGDANFALRRLNETLEEEVRRIAHALHDEAGQMLAAVYI